MKYRIFLSFGILFIAFGSFAQKQNQDFLNYIEKYADLAMQEMERAGIPASIKLAQGLLESSAGKSYLARKGNNHFGIKCGGNWDGKKVFREDDDFDENGKLIKSCFRSYRNVRASYIAHSEFLRDPKKTHRYGFLFRLDPTNYKRWATGLKRAGYATSATYDKKLIRLIETYELYKYDTANPIDVIDDPVVDTGSGSGSSGGSSIVTQQSVNDVKYFLAQENELVSALARRSDMSVKSLIKYNEKITDGSQSLKKGTRVFIQPKRGNYRGKQLTHKVEAGHSMFYISQRYAVKLARLYKCNLMEEGTEPAVGELIRLKGKAKSKPKLASESDADNEEMEMIEEDEPVTEDKPVIEEEPAPTIPVEEEPLPEPTIEEPVEETTDPIIEEEIPMPTPEEIKEEKDETPTETAPEFDEELEFEVDEEETLDEITPEVETNPTNEPELPETEPISTTPVDTNPTPEPTIEEPVEVIDIPEPPVETPPVDAVFYTIERGDTLWSISRKFDTTVEEIRRLNNITGNFIRRGTRLRVK